MDLLQLPLAARTEHTLSFECPSLVLALRSSLVEVSGGGRELLDRTNWLVLPARSPLRLRPLSASPQVLVLGVHRPLVEHVVLTYERLQVSKDALQRRLGTFQLLPRTVWVYELTHRYLFERVALNEHDNETTRFLETEIVKELFFLCRDREEGLERASTVQKHSRIVERALAHVERHLFDAMSIDALAREAATSQSTLLRTFKRELGASPAEYWRARRLDEALPMLRSGDRSVSEVATLVGYDNPTAFTHAFRLRFGRTPSALVPRGAKRGAPG